MTVWIAVPVTLARLQAVVDAGIHWNALDRLVLWALKEQPQYAADLAAQLSLPARLLNEIVVKLMRFGWAEMQPDTLAFRASLAGQRVLHVEGGLPSLEREEPRGVRVVIEPVEAKVFPASDVPRLRHKNDVEEIARAHDVRWLAVAKPLPTRFDHLADAAQRCLRSEEEFLRLNPERCDAVQRFILAAVHGDTIEGLPDAAPKALRDQVLALAQAPNTKVPAQIVPSAPTAALRSTVRNVEIADSDILFDGAAHRELFTRVVRLARRRVIIHSTFLAADGFARVLEDLRAAGRNGAFIDIVYGADKDDRTRARNRNAAMDIASAIKSDPVLRHRAKMHTQSTQSHAKVLVADQGGENGWAAVVGSCNWLSTGYRRVEGSAVLRDGRLVAGVLDELRELCYASAPRSALIGELDRLAASLRGTRGPGGNAHVRLILGDEHGLMMAHARDAATARIWVGGDRFSQAGEAQTLIPMMAAARGGVRGRLLFSRNVSPVTDEDLADLRQLALERGVDLSEVPEGVLHGKFLLWDQDDLVVTSLNWSSANTRRDNPWGEIGIHIHRPGIAASATQHIDRGIEHAASEPEPRRRRPHRRA